MEVANKKEGEAVVASPSINKVSTQTTKENKYPFIKKRRIFIRRKYTNGILPTKNVPYNPEEDTTQRIGDSFAKGTDKPLGIFVLNEEEMRICMPQLLGVKPEHQSWDDLHQKYWRNFSVPIPFEGRELVLDIEYYKKPNDDTIYWRPINTFDYVLYKYCLRYSAVANNYEDLNKSPKIRFYLEDLAVTKKKKEAIINLKDDATLLRLKLQDDKTVLRNILYMFNILPYNEDDGLSDKLKFAELAENQPAKFLEYGNDKQLQAKSFIKRAIATGILTNPAGSGMIAKNGEVLGNNLDEAVVFLSDPKNSALKLEIEALLKNKDR